MPEKFLSGLNYCLFKLCHMRFPVLIEYGFMPDKVIIAGDIFVIKNIFRRNGNNGVKLLIVLLRCDMDGINLAECYDGKVDHAVRGLFQGQCIVRNNDIKIFLEIEAKED